MSHSGKNRVASVNRRTFLCSTVGATLGGALLGATTSLTEVVSEEIPPIPQRPFGKTGQKLPVLGFGGAELARRWSSLSFEQRIELVRYAYQRGIRYFDTGGNYGESQTILGRALKDVRRNVFLVTKVETTDPTKVRWAVEKSLRELQTDYLDALFIHGTPGLEQMSVAQAMKIHKELVRLRDEKITRFIGFSAHSYFDKALALINSGGFDQCMLSYGYLARGHNQILSQRMIALRDACVARAHQLGMGIAAMKVLGAGVLGAWAGYVVPGFDKRRLAQLPAAAIRYVLSDQRIGVLVIGVRSKREIDANIKTVLGPHQCTLEDRALLAEFCAKAFESKVIKGMRID